MTASSFQINQPPGSSYGTWDRSRRGLVLGAMECEAENKSEGTYRWEMSSAPFGVSVTINNGTTHTCNFTIATRGGYLIRLIVNEGEMNQSIKTLYFSVPLSNTGLDIPAANETDQDNSQSPFTGEDGWADKLEAFYRALDLYFAGGAIGKKKQLVKAISPTSSEVGELDLELAEGQIYEVFGQVTGSSTNCNIEFAATAYGTPTNQYEIGLHPTTGVPLWNPDVAGNWEDRNAWGFKGLVDGKLYYRVTNNGANSITMTVQVRAMGFETALA